MVVQITVYTKKMQNATSVFSRAFPKTTLNLRFRYFDSLLSHQLPLDVGRVHEGAVYESNMAIESCIESNHVGLPITPIPD